MKTVTELKAVVIGAGSAGLASAAQLARQGVSVTVLEAGSRPGERWAERYSSLRLNTVRALSGLPGLPIDAGAGDWVSGANFATYLQDYATHQGLRVHTGVKVQAVTYANAGVWQVHLEDETLTVDTVVVATGNAGEPVSPKWARRFTGPQLHTAQYHTHRDIPGDSPLVVGSGNSATELATELAEHGKQVCMAVRTPPLLVKSMQLGISTHRLSVLGAGLPDWMWDASSLASHWMLYRDLARLGLGQPGQGSSSRFHQTGCAPIAERGFAAAVRAGRILIVPEAVGAQGASVELADGQMLQPSALLLATGFKPSFPSLLGHLPVLNSSGRPLAWGAPIDGFPGLFVVGCPSLQGDLREHGREAIRVGQAVAGRYKNTGNAGGAR